MSIQVDLRSRHILDLFLQELQLPEGEAWDVTKFPYRFRKLHADGAGEEKKWGGMGKMVEHLWKTYGFLGKMVEHLWKTYGFLGKMVEHLWKTYGFLGKMVEHLWKTYVFFGGTG